MRRLLAALFAAALFSSTALAQQVSPPNTQQPLIIYGPFVYTYATNGAGTFINRDVLRSGCSITAAYNAQNNVVSCMTFTATNQSGTTGGTALTAVLNANNGSSASSEAAFHAQATIPVGGHADAGAIAVDVFNNTGSDNSGGRGIQFNCWSTASNCSNGMVFINQVSPSTKGQFTYGIAFNESWGNSVSTAFFTDQGSSGAPVNVAYGTLYDGSTAFTTAEYTGPSFQIGPTVASYNAKVAVTGSAAALPKIAPAGSGTTPATNATLALGGLGTGGVAFVSQQYDRTYGYSQPTTGTTVTVAAGVGTQIIDPAAGLAALTLTLQGCTAALDGATFRASSSQAITALTVGAASGTVNSAPTALTAGQAVGWICRGTNTTWYRIT